MGQLLYSLQLKNRATRELERAKLSQPADPTQALSFSAAQRGSRVEPMQNSLLPERTTRRRLADFFTPEERRIISAQYAQLAPIARQELGTRALALGHGAPSTTQG